MNYLRTDLVRATPTSKASDLTGQVVDRHSQRGIRQVVAPEVGNRWKLLIFLR